MNMAMAMDKNKIVSEIDMQISELGSLRTIFAGKVTDRFEGFVALDKIDSKITYTKRAYYFYLVLSIVTGGLLYVAGFAQIFDMTFVDLSKSGLLIIITAGEIVMLFQNKRDQERLIMIKYLLGLKHMFDAE